MPTVFVGFHDVQSRRLPFLPPADQPVADNSELPQVSTRANGQLPKRPAGHAFHYLVKRLLDWLIILLAFGLLFPLMVFIGIAIKFDSPGPFIISQERIGVRRRWRQGKVIWEQTPFPLYQFRTTAPDQSVTAIGRFLRGSSLDQLPQLWNIIRGDLTLFGPRPLLPPISAWDAPEVQRRLESMPGMLDTNYITHPNAQLYKK